MSWHLDPELAPLIEASPPLVLNGETLAAARAQNLAVRGNQAVPAELAHIATRNLEVPSAAGSPVPLRVYAPPAGEAGCAVLLWIHGGGFVTGTESQDEIVCRRLVAESGVVIVSAGYRLAPEHPYPAAFEDCTAVLRWIVAGGDGAGWAGSSLGVAGKSAGGALAAALALWSRDRGQPSLALQMLIYPVLDHRHATPSSRAVTDRRVWNRETSMWAWRCYLGELGPSNAVPAYASPAQAVDLSGVAPAYLLVAGEDLLRDEGIDYSRRLMEAGVAVELHVVPGVTHGWDLKAPDAAITRRVHAEYAAVLRRSLPRAAGTF